MNIYLERETVKAKLIGRGSFTRAYRAEDTVYLITKDWTKEALALWCQGQHIPKIKRLDYEYRGTEYALYKLPYYRRLTASDTKANEQWREVLRTLGVNSRGSISYDDAMLRLLKIENKSPLLEDLETLLSACSNYHSKFSLEFPRRNLKVDQDGNLILLDVVFKW